MARLIGPSEGSREVRTIVTTSGSTKGLFRAKAGATAVFYTDQAATQVADIRLFDGSTPAVAGTVTIDAYSMLPLVQFPDGVDTLYVVVDGGPAWPTYAREDDRFDTLSAAVSALQPGGDAEAASLASLNALASTVSGKANDVDVVHDTGAEVIAGVKTFSASPLVPTPTTSGQVASKGYADTRDALLVPKDYRLPLNAAITANRGALPRIVSLVSGTEDEAAVANSATLAVDTVNYKVGRQGRKMTMAGAVTGRMTVTPVSPATSGLLSVPPAQAVSLWIFLEDVTKITSVNVTIFQDSGNTVSWSRTNTDAPVQALVTGWNLLRWAASEGTTTSWGTLNRIDIKVITNAATTATVGHLYLECPEKARMLFILDRGYKTFVTRGGLARFRASNIPITWALDPTLLGTSVGTVNEVVTEAEIAQYAADGDSVSFHSWDGSATAAFTAAECRTDTARAVKWLQARGYKGRMWRAAWTQNSAANASAINDMVVAQATGSVGTGLAIWPPRDRWNIPRWSVHGRTTGDIDTRFDLWQKTNSLMVVYTHGIDENGAFDITPTLFDYFMTKVEAGIAAGWLQPVTFEQMWLQSGFQWGDVAGGTTSQVYDKGAASLIQTM